MPLSSDYEKFDEIGRSGQTVVYRGVDVSLDRNVAIKELDESVRSDPRRMELFLKEAQFLAQFENERVLRVYSVDRERGWIILELMRGTLVDRQTPKGLKPDLVRSILRQALEGLEFLHNKGKTHGGIRPSNILYDDQGHVKLSDFEDSQTLQVPTSSKYVAPELLRPEFGAFGPPTDLYCLGFTAFELLAGSKFDLQFPGTGPNSIDAKTAWMRWHGSEEPFPSVAQVVPNTPSDLVHLIDKMLQKKVANRPASAREALKQLDSNAAIVPVEVPDGPPAGTNEPSPHDTLVAASPAFQSSAADSRASTSSAPTKHAPTNPSSPKPAPVATPSQSQTTKDLPRFSKDWWNYHLGKPIVLYPLCAGILLVALMIGWTLKKRPTEDVTEAVVKIQTTPKDAQIFLEEEVLEPGENGTYTLPIGKHQLEIKKEGFSSHSVEVDVASDTESLGPYTLNAIEQSTAGTSQESNVPEEQFVWVTSEPSGAEIFVNGKSQPGTTPAELQLKPGQYEVKLALDGHEAMSPKSVEVVDGQVPPTVHHRFTPTEPAVSLTEITINVSPRNATLNHGDQTLELIKGIARLQHDKSSRLELSLSDGLGRTKSFEFEPDELASLDYRLELALPELKYVYRLPAGFASVEGAPRDEESGLPLRIRSTKLDDASAPRLEFVLVTPGEIARPDSTPLDGEKQGGVLTLQQPVYVSIYEISNSHYQQFAELFPEAAGSGWSDARDALKQTLGEDSEVDRHPATSITHDQAQAFCNWIGGELPTENQWEYAALASATQPSQTLVPWSDGDLDSEHANLFYSATSNTVPVDGLPQGATPNGIHNFLGNVAEWCLDEYEAGFGESPDDILIQGTFTIRGCSYLKSADESARLAWRAPLEPEGARDVGFRVFVPLERAPVVDPMNEED